MTTNDILHRWITGYMTRMGMVLWGKDSPNPAPVPDPADTVKAQAAATPSAYTPYGSRVYSGDPNIPGNFGYTESLSPSLQRQFDTKNQLSETVLGRSGQMIKDLPTGQVSASLENPGVKQYWDSQKKLLDETYKQQGDTLDQKLANQGLPTGSEAYNEEQDRFQQAKDSGYQQASSAALGQGFNQALASRQQAYNEIAAALGGAQLNPVSGGASNFVDPTSAQAMAQQARNNNYQGEVASSNANTATTNAGVGAAATVAAAFI